MLHYGVQEAWNEKNKEAQRRLGILGYVSKEGLVILIFCSLPADT